MSNSKNTLNQEVKRSINNMTDKEIKNLGYIISKNKPKKMYKKVETFTSFNQKTYEQSCSDIDKIKDKLLSKYDKEIPSYFSELITITSFPILKHTEFYGLQLKIHNTEKYIQKQYDERKNITEILKEFGYKKI